MCGSVDGHALQIDELKGTKPIESIDLSSKSLNVASALIIASCIKENKVLKELKCGVLSNSDNRRLLSYQCPLTCTLPALVLAVSKTTSSDQKEDLRSLPS